LPDELGIETLSFFSRFITLSLDNNKKLMTQMAKKLNSLFIILSIFSENEST
jgi:hypothetical protein